ASTPNKYILNGVLEVFIPLTMNDELSGKIKRYCPDNAEVHSSPIASRFLPVYVDEKWVEQEEKVKPYLDCMHNLFQVSIDQNVVLSQPFFHQHPKTTQYGLL